MAWKEDIDSILNNSQMGMKRFNMLIHHLKKDQSLTIKYQDPIEWYIRYTEKDYARKFGKKTLSIKSAKM